MRTSRRFLLVSAIVVALGSTAIASATSASADPAAPSTADTSSIVTTPTDPDVVVDDSEDTDWMAESNAEAMALDAYLTAHGIEHTVTTDADGWVNVDYDWEDQTANDAVEDFYWEQYPWTQEEIDANNADANALVTYLQNHGVDATLVTDRHGVQTAEYGDDEATWNAIDDFYWEQYPWTQEEIDANNADANALVAYLQENGVDASIVTDRHGLQSADYEWTDATDELVSAYYGEDVMPTDDAMAVG